MIKLENPEKDWL